MGLGIRRILPWIPIAIVCAIVLLKMVDVPFWDHWAFVRDIRELHNGDLVLADLFRFHNEHRLPIQRGIELLLAFATKWDTRAEVVVGLVFATGIAVVLWRLFRQSVASAGSKSAMYTILSLLVFSLTQWENLLWGLGLSWFLTVLTLVGCLWFLQLGARVMSRHVAFACAVLLAIISQYTLASGLAVWIAALPVLMRWPGKAWRYLWLLIAASAIGSYFIGFPGPSLVESPLLYVLAHPIEAIVFFFAWLGSPVAPSFTSTGTMIAAIVGVALVSRLMWIAYSWRSDTILPWVSLGVFSMANAAMVTYARVVLGTGAAIGSRYTTIALPLLTAVVVLEILRPRAAASQVRSWPAMRNVWRYGAAVALMVLFTVAQLHAFKRLKGFSERQKRGRECVHSATPTQACLEGITPTPDIALREIRYLRSIGWFAEPTKRSE